MGSVKYTATLLRSMLRELVTAICFYAILTPVGVLLRLLGQDFLRLARSPEMETYWLVRKPQAPCDGNELRRTEQ